MKNIILHIIVIIMLIISCGKKQEMYITSKYLKFEVNDSLLTKITPNGNDNLINVDSFSNSEHLIIDENIIYKFKLKNSYKEIKGDKETLIIVGELNNQNYKVEKTAKYTIDKDFPRMISVKVKYKNLSDSPVKVTSWTNNFYKLSLSKKEQRVWSFQGASYESRPDWVLEVPDSFYQKNYMGMNASDYGGGIPIVDIWTENNGFAIGHLESVPKLVSIPLSRNKNKIKFSVSKNINIELKKDESFETDETFVAVHTGDYFITLKNFSLLIQNRGLKFKEIDNSAYEPIWCAWGYERNFNVKDILNTLPKVKELGLKWVVLDDGWQTAEGDWYLNKNKFPNGDKDMKDFVNKIHSYGLKAKLWWVPLAVDTGTDLIKNKNDLLLINKDGKYQDITWWDSYYLCPAYEETIEYTKDLVKKIISDWGYDGLKIDGQHLNAAPPCYNPLHKHKYPEESVEAMPAFYNIIFDTTTKIKKNAVVEICPCGDTYSFYMLASINQPVSSDPTSSWQVRTKGKTIKAIMGGSAPFYGDHVELSSGGEDFASTVGIGGVVGTKFTWPAGIYINTESGDVSLTAEREKKWKKWIAIYNELMLSKGEYLGELYDIGFDKPETHIIRKNNNLYYAFYADEFDGKIELRGLEKNKTYTIFDYINDVEIISVSGANPYFETNFKGYLLIKASVKK